MPHRFTARRAWLALALAAAIAPAAAQVPATVRLVVGYTAGGPVGTGRAHDRTRAGA